MNIFARLAQKDRKASRAARGEGAQKDQADYKISYSQCGEDLIVEFILQSLKVSSPSYLDVGANHPTDLNNTYLFYKKGSQGVCVEPDPFLFAELKVKRSRDTCLNVGVGATQAAEANFYVMTSRTLNTFSRREAERYQNYGEQKIEQVLSIPLVPINTLVRQYFTAGPNFVSLDIEGLDLEVLKTFDYGAFKPEVFCIETLTYTEDKTERKLGEIIEFMNSKGYFAYADTFINTIFVNRDAWAGR